MYAMGVSQVGSGGAAVGVRGALKGLDELSANARIALDDDRARAVSSDYSCSSSLISCSDNPVMSAISGILNPRASIFRAFSRAFCCILLCSPRDSILSTTSAASLCPRWFE